MVKSTLLATVICLGILAGIQIAFSQPQIPTKLFDVRNGNGVIDQGTTYSSATVVVFRNTAAKQQIIQDVCDVYVYQDTVSDPANPGQQIPNPQSKQAFFNQQFTKWLKDVHAAAAVNAATKTAGASAAAAAASDVPPQE